MFVRQYTTFILLTKFILNLSILDDFLNTDNFIEFSGLIKLGIYNYNSLGDIFVYMLPEVLIITLIMLNEIRLHLIGLYFENESAIESIEEGIQRNIEQGDAEKVA